MMEQDKLVHNYIEILNLVESRGVYKEIKYYKVKKDDGKIVKIPFYGNLKIGSKIYLPL